MSVKLFGKNILDQATVAVTTSSALTTQPITRVYDRDRGPLWESQVITGTTITVNQGSLAIAVTDYAIINHNLTVADMLLDSSPDDVTYTNRATFTGVSGTNIFSAISTQTLQYWRLTIPATSSAPQIGEFFLGAAFTLSVDPAHDPGPVDTYEGNVVRHQSIGGFVRKARLGDMRRRFRWSWNLLPQADWDNLLTLFAQIGEGAKHFVIQDIDGTVRWVELLTPVIEGRRVHKVATDSYLRAVVLDFEEAL